MVSQGILLDSLWFHYENFHTDLSPKPRTCACWGRFLHFPGVNACLFAIDWMSD